MLLKKAVQKPEPKAEKIDPRAIRKDYLSRMEKELSEEGVVLFEPTVNLNIDSEFLSLPQEITEVPSKSLGEYLNAFTQQKMYLRTLLGRMVFQVEDAKREYYEVSREVYEELSKQKLSETAKDRIVNQHEKVAESYYNLVDYQKKQYIVEQSIENIEDAVFLISREVTRRTGDFNDENRLHNVGRK